MQESCKQEAESQSNVFPESLEASLELYAECGVGEPYAATPEGNLPPFWDLMQASLWPVLTGLHSQNRLSGALLCFFFISCTRLYS